VQSTGRSALCGQHFAPRPVQASGLSHFVSSPETHMKWYQYIAGFFAGAFLANFVPHFVQGICGNSFPSPFSNPSGEGLSSPTINVVWGLLNLVIGYILMRFGRVTQQNRWAILVFFAGITSMGILLSIQFAGKIH
jgi:hypothetical protein